MFVKREARLSLYGCLQQGIWNRHGILPVSRARSYAYCLGLFAFCSVLMHLVQTVILFN